MTGFVSHKRTARKFLCTPLLALAVLVLLPASGAAQSCSNWWEALTRSFFPKEVDEQGLREFSKLTPGDYFKVAQAAESQSLAQDAPERVEDPEAEYRLRSALQRIYGAGYELYGTRLNPDNLVIGSPMDVNAFASGSFIYFNQGTLNYFLNPAGYLVSIGAFPSEGYTIEQYNFLRANFGWQDDWNSVYFILAHEAGHNLMHHRDEIILSHYLDTFHDYRQAVIDDRKDLAHGRTGGGAKRYLWKSLQSFLGQFETSSKSRERESEADVVGLQLLQRAGFNPGAGLAASEKIARLVGGGQAEGWQGAMHEALCSSHPDWMIRIQNIQTNLNCLQFSGSLCERHIPYPVGDVLGQLRKGLAEVDEYHQDTLKIAEMNPTDSKPRYEEQIEVDPKDAQLQVDGQAISPGRLQLSLGRHILAASKNGYAPSELTIVVFPDVHAKVKLKLKRLKG